MSDAGAAPLLKALSDALNSHLLLPVPFTPHPSPQGRGEANPRQPPDLKRSDARVPHPFRESGEDGRVRLGLAVSGGGDSLAMLHLAVAAGLAVRAVTVDHGLRPEAAAEAARVADICAGLGVAHDTLRWHWDGKGNLQDEARRARRALIGAWAVGHDLWAVALAHTQDDLAETLLMRLARGAGVDGLSAMTPAWQEDGVTWLRPLLGVSRGRLRDWLSSRGLAWIDDPSNDNPRFDRVKARRTLAQLAPLGLAAPRLAEVAQHLAEARQALDWATDALWTRAVQDHGTALRIDPAALGAAPPELRRRCLQRLLQQLAPADYAPRGAEMQRLLARVVAGQGGTLAGCRFQALKSGLWAFREAEAVGGLRAVQGQAWDGRWCIEGPWPEGAEMRALGAEGLALCPEWRASGLPRAALLASPGLWQGERLVAAPQAGLGAAAFCLLPQFQAPGLIIR